MTAMKRLLPALALLLSSGLTVSCSGSDDAGADLGMEDGIEVDLDDGSKARVHSPDKQEVWIQFQPDDGEWTEPELIHDEAGYWTHDMGVETAGETVAVGIDYWDRRELKDDYIANFSVQVICHQTECETADVSDGISTTQLNDDGTGAWFKLDTRTFATWTPESGSIEVSLPDEASSDRLAVAMPDGTLAVLASREVSDDRCEFVLYSAPAGDDDLPEAAASEDRSGPDACEVDDYDHDDTSLHVIDDDGVTVTFTREEGSWPRPTWSVSES